MRKLPTEVLTIAALPLIRLKGPKALLPPTEFSFFAFLTQYLINFSFHEGGFPLDFRLVEIFFARSEFLLFTFKISSGRELVRQKKSSLRAKNIA